jgi:indolepyruvate ferredoxin oxidoreductase, beta subunit
MVELNVVFIGVGGQGTLVAGKLLGQVALMLNVDVKVSEIHGMSQRGGSVVTYVRMGKKVYSPVIEENMADFVLAFEELEGLRAIPLLKKGSPIIVNLQRINPSPCLTGQSKYPENPKELLIQSGIESEHIIGIHAYDLAIELGNVRLVNTILLGAMSVFIDIPVEIWERGIKKVFSKHLASVNLDAFHTGRKQVQH